MSSIAVLPEREIAVEARQLQKTKPSLLVAEGLHKESQIDLYVLTFDGTQQASVFVYASHFDLRPEHLPELDSRISDVSSRIISREFRDASVEELDRAFMNQVRPLISTRDHYYPLHKPPIREHSFSEKAQRYLKGVIGDLKLK